MPSMVDSKVEAVLLKNVRIKSERSQSISGFETHLGRTKYLGSSRPIFTITKRDGNDVEIPDGAINEEGNVIGTYIHGIFNNDHFRKQILHILR